MDLLSLQTKRWHRADAFLPGPPRPKGDPDVEVENGRAWTTETRTDPDAAGATWGALHTFTLTAHVAGDDPAVPLRELLTVWAGGWGPPDDDDVAAQVTWPSRDTGPVLALQRQGFGPSVVLAIARTGRAAARDVPGVTIRPMGSGDVGEAVRLNVGIVEYDARFGGVTLRASTAARLTESMAAYAAVDPPVAWVAERAGGVVGTCWVSPPERAGWVAEYCGVGPAAYLGGMYVDPEVRGTGVGSMLHAAADRALAAAGAGFTLLHHALANPRSTPFWCRQGYRPLWTTWLRRPIGLSPAGAPGGPPRA